MAPPEPNATVWGAIVNPMAGAGGGCSTLDLLKRVSYENASEPSLHASDSVRDEMLKIARVAQQKNEEKKHNLAHTVPRPVANMATLGELVGRPKQRHLPGTPVTRKLKGGKLIRMDGRDGTLSSSRSAPNLAPTHDQASSLSGCTDRDGGGDLDTLDQAIHHHHGPPLATTKAAKRYAVAADEEDPRTKELHDQHNQLEQQLLHVTQKLCRKYTKQLFPRPTHTGSPDKMSEQAHKWAHSETIEEPERYALYMGSRFSTQQQRDYYQRDLQPREPESDRHKRDTAHTKYGDALVRNKHSLRANF